MPDEAFISSSDNSSSLSAGAADLVIFSDDWGRHPSSCQHLTRRLLRRHRAWWVNTIGTRPPRLSWEDFGKIAQRVGAWVRGPSESSHRHPLPPNLTTLSPLMYPGFRRPWQRRFNARRIASAVTRALGPRASGRPRALVTTVPIVADVVHQLDVDRRVYYCVDDFSVWPGLDGKIINAMERELVEKCDVVIAVSEELRARLQTMGATPKLLTHGIDLHMWQHADARAELPAWCAGIERPVVLFWGLVDARLDTSWCRAIAEQCGSLVLAGPQQSPDASLVSLPRVHLTGPVAYAQLPALAQWADVLVMPYADLPVTRAMQPLKLKEYLATGKPAVVRKLPATREWADACDVVESIDELTGATLERLGTGTPAGQLEARERLENESWDAKAEAFEAMILGSL